MKLTRFALTIAAKKPCPDLIPRIGPDAKDVDCYSVHIDIMKNGLQLLLSQISDKGILARELIDGSYQKQRTITWAELKNAQYRITHFYREYSFEYSSILFCILHVVFRWKIIRRVYDGIIQSYFNRKKLIRAKRMEVLRIIADNALVKHDYKTSAGQFIHDRYSYRQIRRPDYSQLTAYYSLLLDSLAASGDLIKCDLSYTLAPNALHTIALYEEEERRHKDNIRLQKILIAATAALAIEGALQLLVKCSQ